nr:MAG TPA: Protein of unknown function (DUF1056) [Caudoviricetes sp.]DAS47783.1 MAG TPA: Protein of unknown function (DUF1056) [Caudoviricetes sp.]
MRFLNQIHTILLLAGLSFLIYGIFLIGEVFGYIATGLILCLIGAYIDKTK